MPGGIRWHPSDEPFSYTMLCNYYLPCVALIIALVVSAVKGIDWMDEVGKRLPSSNILSAAIVILGMFVVYVFFLKVVWMLLPYRIRERIPYDRKEAIERRAASDRSETFE